jgi:hypothetical protein
MLNLLFDRIKVEGDYDVKAVINTAYVISIPVYLMIIDQTKILTIPHILDVKIVLSGLVCLFELAFRTGRSKTYFLVYYKVRDQVLYSYLVVRSLWFFSTTSYLWSLPDIFLTGNLIYLLIAWLIYTLQDSTFFYDRWVLYSKCEFDLVFNRSFLVPCKQACLITTFSFLIYLPLHLSIWISSTADVIIAFFFFGMKYNLSQIMFMPVLILFRPFIIIGRNWEELNYLLKENNVLV